MYADLTRMMVPAQLRTALVDQTRRVLSFNRQVVDWQLVQASTAQEAVKNGQKQLVELMELSMDNARKGIEAAQKLQDEAVEAWTPADSAEA